MDLENDFKRLPQSPIRGKNPVQSAFTVAAPSAAISFVAPMEQDDYTMKLPSNLTAFSDLSHVASTPGAWALGRVPQPKLDDDFTMASIPGYTRLVHKFILIMHNF